MQEPFFTWQDRVLKKINPEDVKAIISEANYIKIFHVDKGYYMVRSPLKVALKQLPEEFFRRIHQRIVVSIKFIDVIARDHLIIEDEKTPLPISRRYYKTLIESLNVIGREDVGNTGKVRA